jgi:hypothetical protein
MRPHQSLGLRKAPSIHCHKCHVQHTWYKTYIITKNYINIITDIILCKEQDDFREKGSCIDCVFGIQTHWQAQRIWYTNLYGFYWFWKDFWHTQPKFWEIYKKRLLQHLIRTIQNLYNTHTHTQHFQANTRTITSEHSRETTPGQRRLSIAIILLVRWFGTCSCFLMIKLCLQTQKIIHKEHFIHHTLLWENTISKFLK